MRIPRLLALIFLSCGLTVTSQEREHSLNYSLGITRFDFFTGLEYQRKVGKFDPFCGFEAGINRTVFQQRLFPKFKLGTNLFLIRKEKWMFGPSLTYGYSLLNVNKSSSSYHRWHELFVGMRFLYGSNLKIGFILNGGYTAERFPNQLTNKTDVHHMSGYHGAILLNYAF